MKQTLYSYMEKKAMSIEYYLDCKICNEAVHITNNKGDSPTNKELVKTFLIHHGYSSSCQVILESEHTIEREHIAKFKKRIYVDRIMKIEEIAHSERHRLISDLSIYERNKLFEDYGLDLDGKYVLCLLTKKQWALIKSNK